MAGNSNGCSIVSEASGSGSDRVGNLECFEANKNQKISIEGS